VRFGSSSGARWHALAARRTQRKGRCAHGAGRMELCQTAALPRCMRWMRRRRRILFIACASGGRCWYLPLYSAGLTRRSSLPPPALRLPFVSMNGFWAGNVCEIGTKSRMAAPPPPCRGVARRGGLARTGTRGADAAARPSPRCAGCATGALAEARRRFHPAACGRCSHALGPADPLLWCLNDAFGRLHRPGRSGGTHCRPGLNLVGPSTLLPPRRRS
jgi:hypothetical protein